MDDRKKMVLLSFCIFFLMMGLFLFYRQAGILQLDMVGIAAYAEYVVRDETHPAMEKEYKDYKEGKLPWRTANNILTAGMFWLFHHFGASDAEYAMFFTQFLFGSLAIVVLYLFLFNLYGNNFSAVIGALSFGISTPLFNAVLSKDHGTEFFFAFLAMYLLLQGIKKKKTVLLFFSSVCLGLLLWMREGTLFFPIIYYGFFLLQGISFSWNTKKFSLDREICNLKNISAVVLPYLVLAAGAWYMYVGLLFRVVVLQAGYTAPLFAFADEILAEMWQWFPLLYLLFVIAGLFFGILKREKTVLFSLGVSLLFFIIFTRNSSFDIRHLGIFVFFPFSLIICYGLVCFLEKENGWKRYALLFSAGIVVVQVFLPGIPLFEQRKEHIFTKEFAEAVAIIVPEEEGIIFVQKDFCLFFQYYAKRDCEGLPADFFSTVDGLLAAGKQVFVLYEAGFGFYSGEAKATIEERYTLVAVYKGAFETFHHADLKPQIYNETLVEVKEKGSDG